MLKPKLYVFILAILTGCSLLFTVGCSEKLTNNIKDENGHGYSSGSFENHWWDYYARGRFFSDKGSYREAIADFNKAIGAQDKDQWQIKADEKHLIDYFPHRELGIVFFRRKEFTKAIHELENSIENTPSAKAHYFLNKARAAKIEREQLDTAPPTLHLERSSTQEITNKFTKTIIGVAYDDNYVAGIEVGGQQVMLELAKRKKTFSHNVQLKEGENDIRVIATDLIGKSTEKILNIYCDLRGPQIEIEKLIIENNTAIIRGNVTDDKGLVSLKINNRPWPMTGNAPGYTFKMAVPDGVITVVAKDLAGNVTRAIVRKNEFGLHKADSFVQQADSSPADQISSDSHIDPDTHTTHVSSNITESADMQSPSIRLEDLGEEQETYDDMISLEGVVSDSSLLIYISVNGEPVLNRRGTKIYFSFLKKLKKGVNEFRIVAADEYGNKTAKTMRVTRKVKNIHRIHSRLSVAILPFERNGKSSVTEDLIHDQLVDSFMEQGRFNIVERKKNDGIQPEQKLTDSDLAAPNGAFIPGSQVSAQTMMTGSVTESPDSLEISGRLIDAETATVLASNNVFGEDIGPDGLDTLLDTLAYKFKQDFPLIEGVLLEVRDNEVIVDIGKKNHIKPNLRLICYREEPPIQHPVTGKVLSSDPVIVGYLRVQEVYDDFSRAVTLNHKLDMIASDKIIAQ